MELRNITKVYKGQTVLNKVSLRVERGERLLITAPSGEGKTTLLRIMMGLASPDSGEVLDRPEKMAAVFQEDRLPMDFSAVQCVKMTAPREISGTRIEEDLIELGLEGQTRKPVRELSGGMRRRVAVCRAVMADTDTLFFDEPFTGLDRETKLTVIDYIDRHCAGKTLVFVSHEPEDAELLSARVFRLS